MGKPILKNIKVIMKKLVYIESSVVSYLTAKSSRDLIVAAYQQITKDWWDTELIKHECFISDFVIDEISRGDVYASKARLDVVKDFKKLDLNETVFQLVKEYQQNLNIPERAYLDLYHLALSVGNGMDYVLSWNFKHIANAYIREKLYSINTALGLRTPTICTPEELIGEIYE
jgi:hypothetical protein